MLRNGAAGVVCAISMAEIIERTMGLRQTLVRASDGGVQQQPLSWFGNAV